MYNLLKTIIDVEILTTAFWLTLNNIQHWIWNGSAVFSSSLLSINYEGVPNWIVPTVSIIVLLLSVGVQFYKLLGERQKAIQAEIETKKAEAEAEALAIENLLKLQDLKQAEIQTTLDKKKLE